MAELRFKFDSLKTVQATAFLLKRAGERGISKGHLIKMLYGADKHQIRRSGLPITGDEPFSMKNGPILSAVLNLLNGAGRNAYWKKHISTAASDAHLVHLLDENIGDDLLSEDEKESLTRAWDIFSKMNWDEVKEFCHNSKNFPEWENPGRSRKAITFERLYEVVGRPQKLVEEIEMMEREEKLFSQLIRNAQTHSN